MAGGEAAPVLEAAEGGLDPVALAVEGGVVGDGHLAAPAGGDAGGDAPIRQSPAEPVGVVAAVGDQSLGLGQRGQHRLRAQVVAAVARAQEHAEGPSLGVGHDVQLGVQAPLGAADEAALPGAWPPFWPRRLAAVRCALRCPRLWSSDQWRTTGSTSIITVSVSWPAVASSVSIRANTPIRPPSGGPVAVLVHDGSWRHGWDGRRSGSGWRSRPLDDLWRGRSVAQR